MGHWSRWFVGTGEMGHWSRWFMGTGEMGNWSRELAEDQGSQHQLFEFLFPKYGWNV